MNMTYSTIEQKNGKVKGKLHFSTGKTVVLNMQENIEFINKINYWNETAIEKEKNKK